MRETDQEGYRWNIHMVNTDDFKRSFSSESLP